MTDTHIPAYRCTVLVSRSLMYPEADWYMDRVSTGMANQGAGERNKEQNCTPPPHLMSPPSALSRHYVRHYRSPKR